MFDSDRRGSVFAAISPPADAAASAAEPARVPLERLEAQICELPGTWPRRRAGSWSCWPISMPAAAGRRGRWARARSGCRGVPDVVGHGAGACPGGPGADPDRHRGDRGGAGRAGRADDGEPAGAVHAGAGLLTGPPAPAPAAEPGGVSAETPADPARCHVEDGPAISVSTAQMLACTDEQKQADGDQDGDPATLHRVQVFEPEDWPERIRRYEDEYPAGPRRPLVVPIPLLGCAHA